MSIPERGMVWMFPFPENDKQAVCLAAAIHKRKGRDTSYFVVFENISEDDLTRLRIKRNDLCAVAYRGRFVSGCMSIRKTPML